MVVLSSTWPGHNMQTLQIPPAQILYYVTLILLEGTFGATICDKAIFVQSRQLAVCPEEHVSMGWK